MLRFGYYIDNVMDRAWFDSSNVFYGECDESDSQYKTVRIVFKNGSVYEYYKVKVSDWVYFKTAPSQGKALNEYFKQNNYEYKKLENRDIEALEEECVFRSGSGLILKVNLTENTLTLTNSTDVEKYTMEYPGEAVTESIKGMLGSLGCVVKVEKI